jgi:hypothetical protein
MVEKGLRRRFPDRFTIESYCDNGLGTIALMNETLHDMTTDGEPVPSLWDHHSNMKMIALASNQSLIVEKALLLPFLNPSILYRRHHKDWVISWRLPDQHSFRVVLVKSLNTTIFSAGFTDSSINWLKNLAENIASANPKYPFIDLKGEDPRLFEYAFLLILKRLLLDFYLLYFNTLTDYLMEKFTCLMPDDSGSSPKSEWYIQSFISTIWMTARK